jgi:hypothetical protein
VTDGSLKMASSFFAFDLSKAIGAGIWLPVSVTLYRNVYIERNRDKLEAGSNFTLPPATDCRKSN